MINNLLDILGATAFMTAFVGALMAVEYLNHAL